MADETIINELRNALPALENKGLTDQLEKAKSLIDWHVRGRDLTPKQIELVKLLISRAQKSKGKPAGTISVILEANPRSPGTPAHADWALLLSSHGKTVDQFVKAGGNLSTLRSAINAARVRIDTGEAASAATPAAVDVDAIVEKVLDKVGRQQVDTGVIIAGVVKELNTLRKVEIVVKKGDDKPVTVKGTAHKQFPHLVKASGARAPNGYVHGIFLQGEASSGKTTGARMLAETLGLKWHFNGAITFPHEMLGFIDGAGKYHRTPFRDAYEHGGVYTFDEVDRSDPNALLAVNPHLANGIATFPDKQIKRHKDCIIICTANTWGLGADANYSGATKLDAAFLSRFPIRINWDIDPALEEKIVTNAPWLLRVRNARQRARTAGLKVLIDTRAAQAGQSLIECGYSMDEAAEMTYLANLKREQRQQIEG